jgi:hypothetical protein
MEAFNISISVNEGKKNVVQPQITGQQDFRIEHAIKSILKSTKVECLVCSAMMREITSV